MPYQQLVTEFVRVLRAVGFQDDAADLAARIFADASRDGVYSHGLNRFPQFIDSILDGYIRVDAKPEFIGSFGSLEQWDGNLGPGSLNAWFSMERAIALSRESGIGCVGLRNSNHWMRGGTYGWQAAAAGVIGICWSNTRPNLPPWGGIEPRLGNNPLVIGIPREDRHVVLDMAMSQFSYGQLETHRLAGKQLPVMGGYDLEGGLTRDPTEILASERPLPIGFWKGSGLSLVLDLIGAILSGGKAVHEISEEESSLSQVFIAIDPSRLTGREHMVEDILQYFKTATPMEDGGAVYYPGERSLRTRQESISSGVLVEAEIWEAVQRLFS